MGGGLLRLSPESALVVVMAQSVTLFLFASTRLQHALVSVGLPAIPLVPVSSSQAVVGAILGIGVLKGGRGIRFNVLGEIAAGWVATPVAAGVMALLLLFVMDNVFDQRVSHPVTYRLDAAALVELGERGLPVEVRDELEDLAGFASTNAQVFKSRVEQATGLDGDQAQLVVDVARVATLRIAPAVIAEELDRHWLSADQIKAVRDLADRTYEHAWAFHRDLAALTPAWRPGGHTSADRMRNQEIARQLAYLDRLFAVKNVDAVAPAP